jgi:hypothetical protein
MRAYTSNEKIQTEQRNPDIHRRNTQMYSRHLRHPLEGIGRHRGDTPIVKIQCTNLRGARACAHERRTGVVAAEAAAAKGHCPRYRNARDGAFVVQSRALLCTERRALHLIVKKKGPVGRRSDRVCARVSVRVRACVRESERVCSIFIHLSIVTNAVMT